MLIRLQKAYLTQTLGDRYIFSFKKEYHIKLYTVTVVSSLFWYQSLTNTLLVGKDSGKDQCVNLWKVWEVGIGWSSHSENQYGTL